MCFEERQPCHAMWQCSIHYCYRSGYNIRGLLLPWLVENSIENGWEPITVIITQLTSPIALVVTNMWWGFIVMTLKKLSKWPSELVIYHELRWAISSDYKKLFRALIDYKDMMMIGVQGRVDCNEHFAITRILPKRKMAKPMTEATLDSESYHALSQHERKEEKEKRSQKKALRVHFSM